VGVLGYADRAAADAAPRALESRYPELEATDVWLRAHETHRDVVAVLYRERQGQTIRRGMPLYKLFAVRSDLAVEQLDSDTSSIYALGGIK
jgi:hypothetical protein